MFHLLPFAVGLLAGAVTVRLIRDDKTKDGLEKVQDRLREATVSSLTAIEHSSARLRGRLASAPGIAEPAESAAPQPTQEAIAAPAAKAIRKRAAPRKTAVKAAAKEGGSE